MTILGEEKEVLARVDELGLTWNPERIQIVSPKKSPNYEAYWKKLYEIRKEKGMTEAQAQELMLDVSYYGTMMVFMGEADGMVSGAVNSTAHTIRSEEHTSELQSRADLVCRLLLERRN